MKTTIIRYTLTLLFCLTVVTSWAEGDEYIINEDFSDLTYNGAVQPNYKGWTLSKGCVIGYNFEYTDDKALRIEDFKNDNNKDQEGWVLTPNFGYSGDAYLFFSYARGSNSETKVIISIEGQGKFEDNTTTQTLTITSGGQEHFYSKAYRILNASTTTRIRFREGALKKNFAIDNVSIRKSYAITLDESEDNSTTISSYKDKLVSATTRTITGGIWNTMCLPFRVYGDVLKLALGDNQNIQLRTFSDYNAGVMSFSAATEVPAGTPFLIKINETVTNPTFPVVTMKEVATNTVTHGDVSFVGTYNPIDLATDGTNLFLTTRNTLASPASDKNRMNGMRAYIVVPSGFNPSNARIMMDDGETTAISLMPSVAEATPRATYNLKGQRIEKARRGLYVVNGKLTLVK